jgi:hypothetical protein
MFPLRFDDTIREVDKITRNDFTPRHREIMEQAQFHDGNISLPDQQWRSILLGAGEEKAVFCICDHNTKVFAVEAIDERTYLNGRFVGGEYFFDVFAPGFAGARLSPQSLAGLTFSGKLKIREFVNGYEWARFQFDPGKRGWLDALLTSWLQASLGAQFEDYRRHYKDVHERNVLFEIRERGQRGVFAIARDWKGRARVVKVGLQPIDVR